MNRKARRGCEIDVHKASLSACIRLHGKGRKVSEEIRTFGTTSDELLTLHDWLKQHEVTEVAMEATGVYWKPVYYVLEDGFRVILVNPAEIKRMPGRKTDVSDCAWLAQLLDNGMLRPSFIPPREIRELRDLVRYRASLKHDHTRIANRLHKVLQDAVVGQFEIKLTHYPGCRPVRGELLILTGCTVEVQTCESFAHG